VAPDLTPDFDDMQSAVTRRTRVLLVIHYFGFPQPLPELAAFCTRNGLLLVEDCAPALFSRDASGPLGRSGAFSIFSLHKTLPLPHGGLLVANDPKIDLTLELEEPAPAFGAELLPGRFLDGLRMRYPGPTTWTRRAFPKPRAKNGNGAEAALFGEAFEPETAMVEASELVQRLTLRNDPATVVAERRHNYPLLASMLPREDQLFPDLPEGVCPLYLPFFVLDKPDALRRLRAKGLKLFPYWSIAHPAIPEGAFPEAERLRAHLLALPVYQGMTSRDVEYLADAVCVIALTQ
jgi:dTDP-4-amino-4,6-dideoxygalactose transaminase